MWLSAACNYNIHVTWYIGDHVTVSVSLPLTTSRDPHVITITASYLIHSVVRGEGNRKLKWRLGSTLFQCWANVWDVGLLFKHYWNDVYKLPFILDVVARLLVNVVSMLAHRLQRWPNLNPTLVQHLKYSGRWRIPSSARHWPYVGLILSQRMRRWSNIKPTLGKLCLLVRGMEDEDTVMVEIRKWEVMMMVSRMRPIGREAVCVWGGGKGGGGTASLSTQQTWDIEPMLV